MNKIKSHEQEQEKRPASAGTEKMNWLSANPFRNFQFSGFFDQRALLRLLPFTFYLTLIAMVYIANTYVAERKVREIDRTQKELKELRSEFITGKSELMFKSKLSQVAVRTAAQGIVESTEAPRKVVYTDTEKVSNK